MPTPPNRLSAPLAFLSAAVIFLVLSKLRHLIGAPLASGGHFGRTLDITLLYVVVLTPAVVGAALHPSRWLTLGVVSAYLAEVLRQLLQLAVPLTSGDPSGSLG